MSRDENRLESLAEVPASAHRRRDFVSSARLWLCWLAVGAALAFWAGDFGLRGERRYLPGPVANPHASLENRCAACHADASPVGGNNWMAVLTGHGHGGDLKCQSCHAGPAHHASQRADEVASCTTCHREHQGRQASLKHVADAQCTGCHRDLANHVADNTPASYGDVTGFADDHPEFRILREKIADPGTIAFDHGLHMRAGLRNDPGSAVPVTLSDIPEPLRQRYRRPGQPDNAAVQLDCASCHRTDAGNLDVGADLLPGAALRPARPSGGAMLPIAYEMHCQACHPLTFEARTDKVSELLSVRHRLQPTELRTFLQGHYAKEFLERDIVLRERPLRPLPGKHVAEEEKTTLARHIRDNVERAEKILYGSNTCGQCHPSLLRSPRRIEPAAIPQVWFVHARFDHTTHRTVDCRECHARAYATCADGTPNLHVSRSSKDVLLPGIATCRQCHAPATTQATGGARFDCVQCHRYHGGDDPLHGRGAACRGPLLSPRSGGTGGTP